MDELAALRQQALRSLSRSSKPQLKHGDDGAERPRDDHVEADFGIDELLVGQRLKNQNSRQPSRVEQSSHHSNPLLRASKHLHSEQKDHEERRNRQPIEKESLKNSSLSRSISTYSSSSRSHSYTSSGSNSPSGSVTSGSSTPTHSSASSKSNHSTHAEMLKNYNDEKYASHSVRAESLKMLSAHQGKLAAEFSSGTRHSQSIRRPAAASSGSLDQRKLRVGDQGYQYDGSKREPLKLHPSDDRRREPLRLQPNDDRRREPLRSQPSDDRRREPLRLQPSDDRRREPLRLQPSDDRRREPLRLQSSDDRRREPLRLQPSDDRRREPLRLQPNDDSRRRERSRLQPGDDRRREPLRLQSLEDKRREPLRLQPSDDRRREPLRLQPSDDRRREPLRLQPSDDRRREPLRLKSHEDRRREPLGLQSNDDRRREQNSRLQSRDGRRIRESESHSQQSVTGRRQEESSRLRERPLRLQSDAIPQHSNVRQIRSPIKTGVEVGYRKLEHHREANSDYRGDSHQSIGHTHLNRSPLHPSAVDSKHNSHNSYESPSRQRDQKQDERGKAGHVLQNRKRRASHDEPIDLAQKRVHVEGRGEDYQDIYRPKESKEKKRRSSEETRTHRHTPDEAEHNDVAHSPGVEPVGYRKEAQDIARECSQPAKSMVESWSEPADDDPTPVGLNSSDIYSVPAKEIEEELDYDENMDDIELHVYRPEDLDVHDKDREEKITEPSITSVPEPTAVDESSDHPKTLNEVVIRSPIRVSPERKPYKSKDSDRLPVKERLYLSKSAIQRKKEERLVHYNEEPKPQLRPSLASRLGPAPHRRGSRRDETSRGNAAAATEEYRKKKHVEVRQEDIERARRITKTLNEHETKATTRTHKTEDKNTQPQEKEKTLDDVIDKIKEKNKSIVKRKKEIEIDMEQYGQ